MFTAFPHFTLGYHGCDYDIGQSILGGRTQLLPSKNEYDWLGSGIYFWENTPQRAFDWAKACSENPRLTKGRIKRPFVLGAVIEMQNCLDLTDITYMKILKEAYEVLKSTLEENHIPLPRNTKTLRSLDCAVINAAVDLNREIGQRNFDTVRGAYIEGEPIYPNAMIFDKTHIQICVRNVACIKGYFLPFDQ